MNVSLELKKSNPSIVAKDSKDTVASSPEQPKKKKLKYTKSQPPPGKFLSFSFIQIEPMSFAYPSDLLDASLDDQLTISDMFAGPKSYSPVVIDLLVSIL